MKRSKKFERLRFSLKGGRGTSAAQPIDEPPLKVENEPQMSDQSTNLDDLTEEDWPSQDSCQGDSDISDLTTGSSRAADTERETMVSNSSSTSSRSYILQELLQKAEAKNLEMTQQIAEMKKVPAQVLTQKRAECATISMHQQEPMALESKVPQSNCHTTAR